MGKLLSFSLTICCIFLLQFVCECCETSFDEEEFYDFIGDNFPSPFLPFRGSDESSSEEDGKEIDSWRRHKHYHKHHVINLNICKCQNESCACCVEFSKYKICDNFHLVYPSNSSQSLSIDFDISINNAKVFSDVISLTTLPSFCYRVDNIGVCGIIFTKITKCDNDRKVELCAKLQLKFNSEVLAHLNVFCLKVAGKNFKPFEDEITRE